MVSFDTLLTMCNENLTERHLRPLQFINPIRNDPVLSQALVDLKLKCRWWTVFLALNLSYSFARKIAFFNVLITGRGMSSINFLKKFRAHSINLSDFVMWGTDNLRNDGYELSPYFPICQWLTSHALMHSSESSERKRFPSKKIIRSGPTHFISRSYWLAIFWGRTNAL